MLLKWLHATDCFLDDSLHWHVTIRCTTAPAPLRSNVVTTTNNKHVRHGSTAPWWPLNSRVGNGIDFNASDLITQNWSCWNPVSSRNGIVSYFLLFFFAICYLLLMNLIFSLPRTINCCQWGNPLIDRLSEISIEVSIDLQLNKYKNF